MDKLIACGSHGLVSSLDLKSDSLCGYVFYVAGARGFPLY